MWCAHASATGRFAIPEHAAIIWAPGDAVTSTSPRSSFVAPLATRGQATCGHKLANDDESLAAPSAIDERIPVAELSAQQQGLPAALVLMHFQQNLLPAPTLQVNLSWTEPKVFPLAIEPVYICMHSVIKDEDGEFYYQHLHRSCSKFWPVNETVTYWLPAAEWTFANALDIKPAR
ncbi:hypothetical protein BC828DRAFT_400122 [Blastocladiella britannica]|nr:hypothetical protein BC828DRAFT_400122 [Blastocladiella britannica]